MKIILAALTICFCLACSQNSSHDENEYKLQNELDSLKNKLTQMETMKPSVLTSLTFQKNDAEEAMNFYVEIFGGEIINIERWGNDAPSKEGTIMQATFKLKGHSFMVSDSPPIHNWDFSPAVSIYIECDSEEEMDDAFKKLSDEGEVAMPADNYGFSQKFGWVIDKFGVSWQLNYQG